MTTNTDYTPPADWPQRHAAHWLAHPRRPVTHAAALAGLTLYIKNMKDNRRKPKAEEIVEQMDE